jgi:hypothetical protein
VSVLVYLANATSGAHIAVDGVVVSGEDTVAVYNTTMAAIIPVGATYRINIVGTVVISYWAELR